MKEIENKPSKIALAFFHWFCRPEFREEIEGDLMERFNAYANKYGQTKANRLFIKDVVLLFRPAIIGDFYQLTNTESMIISKQNKRLVSILATATVLVLIPLILMNFTTEVNWKLFDFLLAGILLYGTGLTLEFILRKIETKRYRVLLIVGLFLALIFLWAELAVGILEKVLTGN